MTELCCKDYIPPQKVAETPNVVEGLLAAANRIKGNSVQGMRWLAESKPLSELSVPQQKGFGQYQGRVVLMALAAELALKFAYEKDNPQESAPATHNLSKLFKKLKGHRQAKIQEHYEHLLSERELSPQEEWCETVSQVFKKCRDISMVWRFAVEEGKVPTKFVMRATYLELATRGVVEEIRQFEPCGTDHSAA